MKKTGILFSIYLIISSALFAYDIPVAAKQVQEYTLENGMEVFILEDLSNPLVNVDFSLRAGFSNQTQNNAGFFKLYSRIIKASFKPDFFTQVQCNSDSTRYLFTTTSAKLEEQLSQFADVIFSTQFSEDILDSELTALKKEVTDNANSAAGLINAAIDSKVFSDSPWKHDSGIYPAVFKRNTDKTARTTLKDIGEKYYTPQNSAIFISGNINGEKALATVKNLFGKYYSSYKIRGLSPSKNVNSKRKYVIHDAEFSNELTQVVVQYTLLDLEQSDLLAAVLENNYSSFKQNTLQLAELNIPGDEYINVASAHKKDNSRLIFQTLMQPPENKKIKTSSLQQALEFADQIKKISETTQSVEIISAKGRLLYDITNLCASSSSFMDNLSQFWALKPFTTLPEQDFQLASPTVEALLSHFQKINDLEYSQIFQPFTQEEPFIFVLVGEEDFKKNKKAYASAGFEEITSKNASWYVQEMYKNQREQFKPEDNSYQYVLGNQSDNSYAERNLAQIKTIELSNGIKVTYKKNSVTTGVSLLMNISGGKLNSAEDNGFEEVMITILANMIQREIYNQQLQGIILGSPVVTTNVQNYTSSILINCDSDDFSSVCSAAAKALIYGEIMPAAADRAVNARQYKKRLENGSSVNQMYSAAINTLFPKSDFTKIYEAKKDILQNTNYNKILEAYPKLLEASRYSFIITGNFDESELSVLETGFGQLGITEEPLIPETPSINFPKGKSQTVKLVHTFLTDIPAEKAGPQPAVLIPTTEFLDPVIYFVKAPSTEDLKQLSIFNAVLNYLGKELQLKISSNKRIAEAKVEIQLPKTNIPAGQITIQNVAHTKELDAAYKETIQTLTKQISTIQANQLIQDIKDYWTQTQMQEAATNAGTATLIQKGYEAFPTAQDPAYYLKEYSFIQTATVEDFQSQLQQFSTLPEFRLYSKDAKN